MMMMNDDDADHCGGDAVMLMAVKVKMTMVMAVVMIMIMIMVVVMGRLCPSESFRRWHCISPRYTRPRISVTKPISFLSSFCPCFAHHLDAFALAFLRSAA
jgi:hypothetical protein